MTLTPLERETIVNYNDEDEYAILYTCQRTVMTKLDKLCIRCPKVYSLVKEVPDTSKTYKIASKNLISFRVPNIMSDEQRLAAGDRLRKVNANKINSAT